MSTDEDTKTAQPGALALLLGRDQKNSVSRLAPGIEFHTHRGAVAHDDVTCVPWGTQVKTHLGAPLTLLRPSTNDLLRNLERTTQTVYPKDAGYVPMKMGIGPGSQVLEAETGSGELTLVFARAVHPTGRVISYENREDVQQLARANVGKMGLTDYVTFKHRDIASGFDERDADAVFLNVANPWDYVDQATDALVGGGLFGSIVPTANQVINLIGALESTDFRLVAVEELLLRPHRTVSTRLRPKARLTPHTDYLVLGRKLISLED